MTFWVVNILNGVSLAMILFLLASGLTLAFGLMRIVNMVHGSFYLLGGYIALSVMQASGAFVLSAILVEQNIALAAAVADLIYIMDKGRMVSSLPPRELMANEPMLETYLGIAVR